MKSSIFKPWFIALLLLAFTSQSMAALTMVCEMPQQEIHASHTMADMDHAAMNHTNVPHHMAEADPAGISNLADAHCATMDHCTSGSCLLPALGQQLSLNTPVLTTVAIDMVDSGSPVASVSSLYRPPIFR